MIDNYEIRLFDIDAPEYKQTCQDKNQKQYKCGLKALLFLKEITKNKSLNCHVVSKGFYDRYLSTCFDGSININAKMISSGWAVTYNNPSKYYNLMLAAKIKKLGIWQGSFIEPKQYRKINF